MLRLLNADVHSLRRCEGDAAVVGTVGDEGMEFGLGGFVVIAALATYVLGGGCCVLAIAIR